jgi:hypothetical protein
LSTSVEDTPTISRVLALSETVDIVVKPLRSARVPREQFWGEIEVLRRP